MQLINFYLNAHTSDKIKKVVVNVTVYLKDIIMPNEIANRENAEYVTNTIQNIDNIQDKNGNSYNSAINIYSNDTSIFQIGKGLKLNTPIKIYMNYNVCISKQLENKINKINIYDENGNTIMDGVSRNGLFTGSIFNLNGTVNLYNNGLLKNNLPSQSLPITILTLDGVNKHIDPIISSQLGAVSERMSIPLCKFTQAHTYMLQPNDVSACHNNN
jgi:hypothetical protein